MKKTNIWGIFVALFILCLTACHDNNDNNNDNPDSGNTSNSNKEIDQWIYDNMKTYYLWTDQITANPDYKSTPATFFNSLLYKKEDRFSWIQENYVDLLNSLNGVEAQEIGFEYTFWWKSAKMDSLVIEVLYPRKGTDAYSKGIERGDFITSVNGQAITGTNYKTILSGSSSYKFTVSKNLGNFKLSSPATITVSPSSKYAENPVYLYKTIATSGGNTGYLAYNFFANDPGDSTETYNKDLVNALNEFYNNNVSNLVLDLRYNSGGAISAAQILASGLVKSRTSSLLFAKNQYNTAVTNYLVGQYGSDVLNDYFLNSFTPEKPKSAPKVQIPNLGDKLNHIYILTGKYTASASELIINGLKPYMNITLIGDTTYGKNVGSISIYDETSKTNKWGMQPIITKIYNSEGKSDYTNGFAPDYLADDYYDPSGYARVLKPLGDTGEYMLSIALGYINGTITKSSATRSTTTSIRKAAKLDIQTGNRKFDMFIGNKRLKIKQIK
ncbi:MAG: hypothetical protein BGN96_04685 [Bacteroidales bacterium 45-6]|mgnify:CR=1 FL=1|nr:MAG: hypothetical protein BGN96_04685 [Bacteroidales bacterium 45-6]